LSSGERAKVLLAELILGHNNLLVLDEPTNYLDIETQDVLLEALASLRCEMPIKAGKPPVGSFHPTA
jgi:ATPase subunit of ABC transporter with duplicated ATPase domains